MSSSDDRLNTLYTDIGAALKAARERLGLTLEDIAHRTKLSQTNVQSIETGRLDKVGPVVYVRGFVRSYAREVSMAAPWIDAQMELLGQMSAEPALIPASGSRIAKTDVAERGMLAASYLVGTVILLSAVYFVTQFDRLFSRNPTSITQQSAAIESQPSAVATPATATQATQLSPVADQTLLTTTDSTVTVLSRAASAPEIMSRAASAPEIMSPAITALALPAEAPIESAEAGNLPVAAGIAALPQLSRSSQPIQIAANGTVWVEITDSTGQRLEFNNLSAGVIRNYAGAPPYTFKIGNAAQASVTINGQPINLEAYTRGSVAKFKLVERQGVLVGEAQENRAENRSEPRNN